MRRYLQRRRDKKGPAFTYEVLIVDDGSTDATVRVAMEYVRKCGNPASCFHLSSYRAQHMHPWRRVSPAEVLTWSRA